MSLEISTYFKIFKSVDNSGEGLSETAELDSLFRRLELVLKKEQVVDLVKQFDADGSGCDG